MHHDAQVLIAHERATQTMLGPEGERTVSSTAFERTGCARKIRKKRCYSVGVAVQLSRRVVAPTASLAQERPAIHEYQQMVEDLLDVRSLHTHSSRGTDRHLISQSTSDMLLKVQEALPSECVEAYAANVELTGQPEVRRRNIYGTSSVQINISAAGLSASGQFRLSSLRSGALNISLPHWQITDSLISWATLVVSITMAGIVQIT